VAEGFGIAVLAVGAVGAESAFKDAAVEDEGAKGGFDGLRI
jgi:hypothetical protein